MTSAMPRNYESYDSLDHYSYGYDHHHVYDMPPPPPPPPRSQQPSVDPYKFKTKLCKNFANGSCQFGERCAFAHGDEELRESPPPTHERQNSAVDTDEIVAPPSYSEFVGHHSGDYAQAMTPEHSRPSTPPHASHYRYDPYTPQGFIYCEAPTPVGSPSKCPPPLL